MSIARHTGCLLGLACGDAVGTTMEFQPRGTFPLVTDMVGGGPFRLPVGAWTDDTSMALCLAASLVENKGFEAADQMRRYWDWFEKGYFSSTGRCFDIGNTVRHALFMFRKHGDAFSGSTEPDTAGNGCLMRLAPIPMFFHRSPDHANQHASESARTTHGAQECLESCRLFSAMLVKALQGESKEAILFGHDPGHYSCEKVRMIAEGNYRSKNEKQIRGSGYVIDCLEASAWCFHRTESFREAILMAVNLGDDADTTGAVCGQLAGAFYSEDGIPKSWVDRLVMKDEIRKMAIDLYETGLTNPTTKG